MMRGIFIARDSLGQPIIDPIPYHRDSLQASAGVIASWLTGRQGGSFGKIYLRNPAARLAVCHSHNRSDRNDLLLGDSRLLLGAITAASAFQRDNRLIRAPKDIL